MFGAACNYVWQLLWIINELIPCYAQVFSPFLQNFLFIILVFTFWEIFTYRFWMICIYKLWEIFIDKNHNWFAQPSYLLIFFSFFQIRAEKPYYMADPEVDSLVSKTEQIFFEICEPIKFWEIFWEKSILSGTFSKNTLLTAKSKTNENAYLHHLVLKGLKWTELLHWHL